VDEDALTLLRQGEMELEGLLPDASNTTLRAVITLDGVTARCIYKPVRGERPLWDFPDGTLAGRESAAYLVSVAGGWDLVPPTVLREGPLGPGACQLWIDDAYSEDAGELVGFVPVDEMPDGWRPIIDARGPDGRRYRLAHADDPRLAAIAVFDVVVNNADRKGGHVLCTPSGRVYGVDHGVCFHVENKLRTVLWGWAEQRLDEAAGESLRRLAGTLDGPLHRVLASHLTEAEIIALSDRVHRLLEEPRYPAPGSTWRPLPWPPM
jgi:uncharacterized repeat protein (TIGR03843 family)